MALTGPGDSTVSVRKPAGVGPDAVVKRQAKEAQAVQTLGHLLIDAYRSHALAYANTRGENVHGSMAECGTCTCKMKT